MATGHYPHRPNPKATTGLESVSDCCGVRAKPDQGSLDGELFCVNCFNLCGTVENPHYQGKNGTPTK